MASVIERLQNRSVASSEKPRVIDLENGDADQVLDALAPDLRRQTYRSLFEEPRTASELAETLDTSVQNVQYHLSTLQEAELIEPIDTIYSEKGNEMTVYGPTSDPLVLVGDEERLPATRRSMTQLMTGLSLLAVASLLVQWSATALVDVDASMGDNVGVASPEMVGTGVTDTLTWLVFVVFEPGFVFFVGCLFVASLLLWIE